MSEISDAPSHSPPGARSQSSDVSADVITPCVDDEDIFSTFSDDDVNIVDVYAAEGGTVHAEVPTYA